MNEITIRFSKKTNLIKVFNYYHDYIELEIPRLDKIALKRMRLLTGDTSKRKLEADEKPYD